MTCIATCNANSCI